MRWRHDRSGRERVQLLARRRQNLNTVSGSKLHDTANIGLDRLRKLHGAGWFAKVRDKLLEAGRR